MKKYNVLRQFNKYFSYLNRKNKFKVEVISNFINFGEIEVLCSIRVLIDNKI